MKRFGRFLIVPLLLVIAACATAPPVAVSFPPQPAGTARIVLYRDIGYYDPANVLTVSLNDKITGAVGRGEVIYRDVTPGTYTISFTPTRVVINQFKTVTVAPGNIFYVKIDAMPERPCAGTRGAVGECDIDGFTGTVMDPAIARQEITGLRLGQG
ncbi:MAG TPA: DUF2846 domain-containing protein [Stellaceae bacterium]|jgi:hypothetical protein